MSDTLVFDGIPMDDLTIWNHDRTKAKLLVVDRYVSPGQAHVMKETMFISPQLGARLPPPDAEFTASGHTWPAWNLDRPSTARDEPGPPTGRNGSEGGTWDNRT